GHLTLTKRFVPRFRLPACWWKSRVDYRVGIDRDATLAARIFSVVGPGKVPSHHGEGTKAPLSTHAVAGCFLCSETLAARDALDSGRKSAILGPAETPGSAPPPPEGRPPSLAQGNRRCLVCCVRTSAACPAPTGKIIVPPIATC